MSTESRGMNRRLLRAPAPLTYQEEDAMAPIIARCAGLDVHKATVAVWVRVPPPGDAGKRKQEARTFGTMTADLLALRDWLTALCVTDVAMESTGVYWKPIYYVLEDAFICLLVNAATSETSRD